MFFECLFSHPFQCLRWRTREQVVPTTFRLNLSEEPCADGFLFALGQFVRFVDRTLK